MSLTDRIFPNGEMAARLRERGFVESLSPATRAAVQVCLASTAPMLIWCGPNRTLIYNDAAIPVLGAAHPIALGMTVPDESSERWRSIRADLEQVASVRAAVTKGIFTLTPLLDGDEVVAIIGNPVVAPHDETLAAVGHELRNPMSAIYTMVQALLMRTPTPELQLLERAARRAVQLLDDVQDTSRLARHKLTLQRTVVELSETVRMAVAQVSSLLDEKHHKLVVRVPRVGLRIDADPSRMTRAIANVIGDVAQMTLTGQTITVEASAGVDHITLRIFDEQARDAQPANAVGMGVSIARTIIDLHGGTLAARTASDVEITLSSTNEPVVTPKVPTQRARKRLLLVEDNDDAARALKSALEQLGYDVALAHDAPIALSLARTFRPDVALLDLGLPVMDGWELARRLRDGAELPLVAVTARDQDTDKARSAELGFAGHLVKPIDLPQLQRLVDHISASPVEES